jgi:predicted O-methyltransferase YrrM
MDRQPSSPSDFVLLKTPAMMEEFIAIAQEVKPRNLLELGVFRGGSIVAYNELLRPAKLVGIDFHRQWGDNLESYVRSPDVCGHVSLYDDVNQADRTTLAKICADSFGSAPIDVVVDDASHLLSETRESFRELFPRLRPGGIYVIEDWAWAHWPGERWQRERGGDYFRGKEPVSSLIVELLAICASRQSLIEKLQISFTAVYIFKGWEKIEPGFDLSRYVLNRGDALPRFRA